MEPLLWHIHFLSAAAPTLLRVVVGFYFLYMARFMYTERSGLLALRGIPIVDRVHPWMIPISAIATAFVGTMFIVGIQSPIASILGVVISVKHWYATKNYARYVPFSKSTYILLFVLCLALLLSGPGIFAFDSPLY